MQIVIFGLSVSSSWGNGHAALWRGLIRALHADGHYVTFFERDVSYYAQHRDLFELPGGGRLVLYPEWDEEQARQEADKADVALLTSYCPDAQAATAVILESRARLRCVYDLDTPVTLARIGAGEQVDYVGPRGYGDFDLVLSYTGGSSLDELVERLGARRVVPLYGSADPDVHRPGERQPRYDALLSYLGTFAADRQSTLERLFVVPARTRADSRFVLAGALYPADFPWTDNVFFVRHLPASEHAAFYASSRFTLNVTRAAMVATGWCPSGRLFEAAACGAPIVSDVWEGLDCFFDPGDEIIIARTTDDVLAALDMTEVRRTAIGRRARARMLAQHTAARRARQMIAAFEGATEREMV
ncbi:MAG TPA: glycosyltransferase [Bradyrhizobium sp.]